MLYAKFYVLFIFFLTYVSAYNVQIFIFIYAFFFRMSLELQQTTLISPS